MKKLITSILACASLISASFDRAIAQPITSTQTITICVPIPAPGQPVVLPDSVPPEIRPDVIKYVEKLRDDPMLPCIFAIVVIVVVIVAVVIIYTLWRACQLIPPPQTNQPPTDPFPTDAGGKSGLGPVVLFGPDQAGQSCELQACTDLGSSNWFTLASLSAMQALDYTNEAVIWSVVAARSTNGTLIGSTIIRGPSTNALMGDRPINIPYPGQLPERLFFRLQVQ